MQRTPPNKTPSVVDINTQLMLQQPPETYVSQTHQTTSTGEKPSNVQNATSNMLVPGATSTSYTYPTLMEAQYVQPNTTVYYGNHPIQYPTQQVTPQYPIQGHQQHQMWMPTTNALSNFTKEMPNPNEWKRVQYNKRSRNGSPEKRVVKPKQSTLADYWLNAPQTSNRYEILSTESRNDEDKEPEEGNQEKIPKPPPIFVTRVGCISPLHDLLEKVAKDGYETKLFGREQVKIQPKTSENYTEIVQALTEKKTEFHTYQNRQERSFRVVLKNIHHSTDSQVIKNEIEKHGHIVTNVCNIRQRHTKDPLPMFYVELKPQENNKDIYTLKTINSSQINFEPPRPKRDIPQCTKCQRYGHTKSFCYHSPRCVKCAGDHTTISCQRKEKTNLVKCVLCDGNHPANYKGCSIYKDLQKKKYPPLRKNRTVNDTQTYVIPRPVQSTTSYAQALTNPNLNTQPIPQSQEQQGHETQLESINNQQQFANEQQPNDIQELKKMMKSLIEQMGTIINLLTMFMTNNQNARTN